MLVCVFLNCRAEPKKAELSIKTALSWGLFFDWLSSGLPELETDAIAKAVEELDKIGPPKDFSALSMVFRVEFWPKSKLAANMAAIDSIGKRAYEILFNAILMVNILLLTGYPVNMVK
jgi:hypothetical protein